MAIGVVIKRLTQNGEDARVLLPHIVELRALAVRQPGGHLWNIGRDGLRIDVEPN